MVGPNKQFDQDAVLDKALQVFWNKGYEATSMQDLVSSMGINRASLYQTYGNKHSLFMTCIDRYIENTLTSMRQMLELSGPALNNLKQMFTGFVEQSLIEQKHGCFINNSAVELGPHDADIAEKLRNSWNQFEKIFETIIERAIKNNEIDKNTNVEQLALLLNINLQGLMVKTKVNTPKEKLIICIDALFDLIRS
ncbi:MAG: TetR/AcrR family transcriptional regulator [Thiohalomonadales bacterium]